METAKPSRRRSLKPKPENFYKNLGVRANASQALIKQKYIESVKSFPPETHPEEFQQIRRAYETLRDPLKRREYDLMRKYGGKLEKIMEDAWNYMEIGHYEKAEKLVNQAFALMPDNPNILLVLALIALHKNDPITFQEQFDLIEKTTPDDEKPMIMVVKARMLLETEHPEEAIRVLDDVRASFPEQLHLFLSLYTDAYQALNREEDLWQLILTFVPAPGTETPEDISIFVHWLNTMFELEQWSFKSIIQQRIRKLLKSVKSEDDKLMILDVLRNEHDGYLEEGRFREAEIFIDFVYYIDSANPEVRQQRSRTQELMRVAKEIDKLGRNENTFPFITYYALKWFYHDYWSLEDHELYRDSLHPSFFEPAGMNLEFDEIFAHGIMYMRKKYPLVYRYFQDQWDELFHERVQLLNREARRQLKI